MDKKQLKRMLAGFAIASLVTGANLTMVGCDTGSETGSTDDTQTEGTKTSCSGGTSCSGSTTDDTKTSCSGGTSCSGKKTDDAKTSCSG